MIVDDLFLCICGGFQPEVLTTVLHGGDLDGMSARFSLLVWPDTPEDFTYVDRPPDIPAANAVERALRRLHEFDPFRFFGPFDWINAKPALRFDDAAQAVFREWFTKTQKRLRTGAFEGGMQAHVGKFPGLFGRLTVVHHLIRYALRETQAPCLVDAHTANAVEDFIDGYLEPHAQRIYRHLGQDPARQGARRIAEWIVRHRVDQFTARDVRRNGWSGLTDPETVTKALDHLANVAGWLSCQDEDAGPRGGRPTTRYRVNPKVQAA